MGQLQLSSNGTLTPAQDLHYAHQEEKGLAGELSVGEQFQAVSV